MKKINYRTCILPVVFLIIIIVCLVYFRLWGEVPNHNVDADIAAKCYLSDSSYCSLSVNVDAASTTFTQGKEKKFTIVRIYHSPNVNQYRKIDKELYNKFKTEIKDCKGSLDKMSSFYILDYKCQSQTNAILCKRKPKHSYTYTPNLSLTYMSVPQWDNDSMGDYTTGWGFVAYPERTFVDKNKPGEMKFNTSLLNANPGYMSPWDITQANFNLSIKCQDIRCDTITVNFHGATIFSEMYPRPDKITMSSIEFTDSASIREIQKNGLRFHAEFTELKEKATVRAFVLSMIMSIVVAFLVNMCYGYIYNGKAAK